MDSHSNNQQQQSTGNEQQGPFNIEHQHKRPGDPGFAPLPYLEYPEPTVQDRIQELKAYLESGDYERHRANILAVISDLEAGKEIFPPYYQDGQRVPKVKGRWDFQFNPKGGAIWREGPANQFLAMAGVYPPVSC